VYKKIFIVIFFLCFLIGDSVESELDKNIGFIGDVINWSIRINQLSEKDIQFPELKNFNENITIRNQSFIKENSKIIGVKFELMVWDTGAYILPEYGINILKKDGSIDYSISSDPLELKIESILNHIETKELRPVISPVSVKDIFPIRIIILLISLFTVILTIIWLFKQRELMQYKKAEYIINESAEEKAKRRLNSLDINILSKDFYIELSHISREYFESKYFIRVLEMTTEDIQKFRSLFPIDDKEFSTWYKFLIEADKVKFAKEKVNQIKMNNDKKIILSLIK
tara:strand:- start:1347 stop:2201 length:855 start_codon:yes stop_codon:yes gene_type:complete